MIGVHALRNALLPVTTVAGLQAGTLLAGAVITETIFAWPGLGRLVIQAINSRDYPLVQGCVLAIGCIYVAVNTATDLLHRLIDSGVNVQSFSEVELSLEEVFMMITKGIVN